MGVSLGPEIFQVNTLRCKRILRGVIRLHFTMRVLVRDNEPLVIDSAGLVKAKVLYSILPISCPKHKIIPEKYLHSEQDSFTEHLPAPTLYLLKFI